MEETWKPVVSYEGLYEVSNAGNIRRIGAWCDGRKTKVVGVMRLGGTIERYCRISLCKEGKHRQYQVHRLVMAAFIGPAPARHEVNHKNGNKRDNRLENLEYMTHAANQLHKYKVLNCPTRPGSKHHNAKLTEADVFAIRALSSRGWGTGRIATEFGVSGPTISDIVNFKRWTHI